MVFVRRTCQGHVKAALVREGWRDERMEERRLIGVRILVSRNPRPSHTHLIAN